MKRLQQLFQQKQRNVLSVYFTAGYPAREYTGTIIRALAANGADMIEIGMPFSDPLADGPTIQQSSARALEQGMSVSLLFRQLRDIRRHTQVPLVLMGYLNPVLQYGFERFCCEAAACGIDGLILPDMPLSVYGTAYRETAQRYGLAVIFLVCPHTGTERIRQIDEYSEGFVYLVTTAAVTGGQGGISEEQLRYFSRIQSMNLRNPVMAGFGIRNPADLDRINPYVNGGIIGSAFIRALMEGDDPVKTIAQFMLPFTAARNEHTTGLQHIAS